MDIYKEDLVIDGERDGRIGVGGRSDAHMIRNLMSGLANPMTNLSLNFGTLAANGGSATATAALPQARPGLRSHASPVGTSAVFFTAHGMARVQAVEISADGTCRMTAQNFNTATKAYSTTHTNILGIR